MGKVISIYVGPVIVGETLTKQAKKTIKTCLRYQCSNHDKSLWSKAGEFCSKCGSIIGEKIVEEPYLCHITDEYAESQWGTEEKLAPFMSALVPNKGNFGKFMEEYEFFEIPKETETSIELWGFSLENLEFLTHLQNEGFEPEVKYMVLTQYI